ncbi:Golgi transport complex subunit 3 [Irineochytrium annulatum]|nr:Golgi transport complex subunit 3 [Irineochytrium annulatum]
MSCDYADDDDLDAVNMKTTKQARQTSAVNQKVDAQPAGLFATAPSALNLTDPMLTTNDFLTWFAAIEDEMEHSQEDVYSLKEACENILREQTQLADLADRVRERLEVFDVLEPAVKLMSSGGEAVCLQEGFVDMLSKLDMCLEFVVEHVSIAAV